MTKENIKISAIIKTYNSEKTLCEVLEAIKDWAEIIIIDFHSNDDTIDIAKEYKAKIIYADRGDFSTAFNNAVEEASCEWIFILEDDEIIPQKLLFELEEYIEKPKKNKFALTLSKKIFYSNKEIKAARIKEDLCFFKKGAAIPKEDCSEDFKVISGKVHKLNKNFKIKNASKLKYSKNSISKKLNCILQKNKILIKNKNLKQPSLFIKPLFAFLYWYFIKRAFLSGKTGYIFSIEKALEKYILELLIFEKTENDYDI